MRFVILQARLLEEDAVTLEGGFHCFALSDGFDMLCKSIPLQARTHTHSTTGSEEGARQLVQRPSTEICEDCSGVSRFRVYLGVFKSQGPYHKHPK